MTIYYQHIGEKMAERDFPRSLGTLAAGLKRFRLEEIDTYLDHLPPFELADIKSKLDIAAPTGFQIWGIPTGAMKILRNMSAGDYLMLLESSDFAYCGQVLHRMSELCHDLSMHIWGESRFPVVILLQGELISYGWDEFVRDFNFAANYHMRGNTANISDERVAASRFGSEEAFVAHVLATKGTNPIDQELDFRAFADGLSQHLRQVKEIERHYAFRKEVFQRYGAKCAFCGFDVPAALDAAHIVPKEHGGTDDPRNGIPLCATHHRLFDHDIIGIEPAGLAIVAPSELLGRARLDPVDWMARLAAEPHKDALVWRWNRYSG